MVGVPQSVAVSKDESFAIVTSAMKVDPADPKKTAPDDRISVIDLKANPPAVTQTLQAGPGVTGVSISPSGTLALTANRNDGSVSIFTISGKTLTAAGKLDLGNKNSGPSHVAFLPDGKSAILTRDGDHRVSILAIDGNTVTDTKRFMVGGFRPYSLVDQPERRRRGVRQSGRRAGRLGSDQRGRPEDHARNRGDLGRPDAGRRVDGAGRLARRRDPAQRLDRARRIIPPTTTTA